MSEPRSPYHIQTETNVSTELEISYALVQDGTEIARGAHILPVEPAGRVLLIDVRSVVASRAERLAAERDAIVVRPYVPLQ